MSLHRATFVAVALLPLIGCGPPPQGTSTLAAPSRAATGTALRDELVTVSLGAIVRAVGVSRRFVYAAAGNVIAVYDRTRQAWLPPFTRDAGFDPSAVRAIGVDPEDDSAWLFTAVGAWTLQPLTGFVMRATGQPPARLLRGSLEAVYREFPGVEAFSRVLTRDEASLMPWPVIAAARAPDRAEVWLGSQGGGLYRVDPLFNRAESLPFGLATAGAGAIARDAERVWVAPATRAGDARSALTVLSRDLQDTRWIEDPSRRAIGASRATALAITSGNAWIGTPNGLFRATLARGGASRYVRVNGLPSEWVLSLLPHHGGLWVGTSHGGVLLPNDSTAVAPASPAATLASVPVRALAATGDTLWAGTDNGLLVRAPTAAAFVTTAPSAFSARLRQPVTALAASDTLVVVAQSNAVLTFSRQTGAWAEPWMAAPWPALGGIDVVAADARAVWAGGPFGVIALNRVTGGSRLLRTGSDLPDAVTGIVLDGPWAWVATLGGVVRVRRTADGLIP